MTPASSIKCCYISKSCSTFGCLIFAVCNKDYRPPSPYTPCQEFTWSFVRYIFQLFPSVKHHPHIVSHVEELRREASLSAALLAAIHSRKTTTDVTHMMSFASISVDQVFDTLYATLLTLLEGPLYKRMAGLWTWEVLGIAIEIYG